jgi:glycosyltransferase involved in cell wall biosynthesis
LIHATSPEEALACREGFPSTQTIVVPNGVDVPGAPGGEALANEGFEFIFLGRLHPIKGIEQLLEACARVARDEERKFSLTIAGAGDEEYSRRLERLVRSLGLESRVRLVGFLDGDDRSELLRRANALVLPSHSENFGMVVAEALAHGTPVIASQGTPWRDLEARGCGLWVRNTPECLAEAMARMMASSTSRMGQLGRAWMQEEFSWPHVASRMIEAYRRLCACTEE